MADLNTSEIKAPFTLGTFEVTDLGDTPSGRKWRIRNLTTTLCHVTYGGEDEVLKQVQRQSDAWTRRLTGADKVKGQRGSAWRRDLPPRKPAKASSATK